MNYKGMPVCITGCAMDFKVHYLTDPKETPIVRVSTKGDEYNVYGPDGKLWMAHTNLLYALQVALPGFEANDNGQ